MPPPIQEAVTRRMDPQEERFIRKWHDTLKGNVKIHLFLTGDPRSDDFSVFADRFAALAPKVQVLKENSDTMELPAILIGKNIRYHALPSGKEVEPFLDALSQTVDPSTTGVLDPEGLERIALPVDLDLYISPQCGFCPSAVNRLIPLALHCPLIRLSIVDALLFNDRSQAHGIRSVPTVLLDQNYRWTGHFDLQELVDMMVRRDPANLRASTFESMIKEGAAAKVAELMRASGEIFPAFLELLVHEKWPVRLGAMVVMEELIEKDIDLVLTVLDALWEASRTADDPIKGDICHILGEAGNETVIPKLRTVLSDNPGEELKEAAEEAIERILQRHLHQPTPSPANASPSE